MTPKAAAINRTYVAPSCGNTTGLQRNEFLRLPERRSARKRNACNETNILEKRKESQPSPWGAHWLESAYYCLHCLTILKIPVLKKSTGIRSRQNPRAILTCCSIHITRNEDEQWKVQPWKKMLRDSCQQSPLPAEKLDTTQRKVESTFRINALFKRNDGQCPLHRRRQARRR